MQKAYITALYDLIQKDSQVVSLLSDSGTDYDELLSREFPKQCFNLGICEEHKVAAAAGLAYLGKIPFVYTTGAFLAYRAIEFIRDDVCFQNQNVKIIGMGSGLAWSTLGPSHHTTEDVSMLRVLPNLVLLSPASPMEVKKAVQAAYKTFGPVYIRIGMSHEREIYDSDYNFEIGKNIVISEGNDITIFTTGSIISEVLDIVEKLRTNNISVRLINVHSLNPFDKASVLKAAMETRHIFSVEEHSITGGLGSIISEILADENVNIRFKRIGLPNCFGKGYGTHSEIRKINNLDSESIYLTIRNELNKKT